MSNATRDLTSNRPVSSQLAGLRSIASLAASGFLASTLVVIGGSLAGAAQPATESRWSFVPWAAPPVPVEPSVSLLLALLVYFGGLVVLVRAWLLLRRSHLGHRVSSSLSEATGPAQASNGAGQREVIAGGTRHRPVTAAVVVLITLAWALPMLVGPPLGSRDVYAYGAQGRLAEQGYDVYQVGPSDLGESDPILPPVDPLYRETPVLYGPAFVSLSSVGAGVTGASPLLAVFFYRLLAVAGLVGAGIGIHSVAKSLGRDPVDALILSVANPLVLVHLVSGAHNDAIMLGLLLPGIALGLRMRLPHVAVVLCAIAAAIKLPALLAVAFIGWPWVIEGQGLLSRFRRFLFVGFEALSVLAIAGQLTGWGWSWVRALLDQEHVEAYLSLTTLIGGGLSYLPGVEFDEVLPVTRLVGLVLAAGLTSMLLFRRPQSWVSPLAWSFLLWAVLHPTTQPWYLTWGLMVLAAAAAGQRNRIYIAGSAVAVFAVLPIGPQLGLALVDNTTWFGLLVALVVLFGLTLNFGSRSEPHQRAVVDKSTVSILVPTRNESLNVAPLVASLHHVMSGAEKVQDRSLEIFFVDDSEDDTPDRINELVRATYKPDCSVRALHRRPSERWGGLSGAVVDGLAQVNGHVVVVMDGDLQHPASYVPELIAAIDEGADLVIASRRLRGQSNNQLGNDRNARSDHEGLTKTRHRLSLVATALAKRLFPRTVGQVSDPLSGFFAVRLDHMDLSNMQPDGFKILVEILATHPELQVREVPFTFSGRLQGMSKASSSEGLRFLGHLFDLRVRRSRIWSGARLPQTYFKGDVVAAGGNRLAGTSQVSRR